MDNHLKGYFLKSACLYAAFLIPTLLLLDYTGFSDLLISRNIQGAWQASFWHIPGLSADLSRIMLDILTAVAVGGLTWLFYRGFQYLNALPTLPEAEEGRLFRMVLLWALVCGVLLVSVVPFHSSDMYGYLNRGFQQSVYGVNPYVTPLGGVTGWQFDPLFHAHWVDNPCPYGFFFAGLVGWLTQLIGPSFTLALLGLKCFNLLLLLGSTQLVYRLAKRLDAPRPWLSAYLFGANPLVLLHTMGNGHNDILLACLLLLALWALLSSRRRVPKGKQWLALPLLMLSILTKYASLLALPFFALYLIRRRAFVALWMGALLSMVLLVGLALPYVDVGQPWPWRAMLDNAGRAQHSLVAMVSAAVYYPVKWAHGPAKIVEAAIESGLKPFFWLGFIGFYCHQLWRFIKGDGSSLALVRAVGLTLTVMVALISAKFHAWYVVMFLPVALLLPDNDRLRQFSLTFGLFQVAAFTVFQNLPVFGVLTLTVLPLWLTLKGKTPFSPPAERG